MHHAILHYMFGFSTFHVSGLPGSLGSQHHKYLLGSRNELVSHCFKIPLSPQRVSFFLSQFSFLWPCPSRHLHFRHFQVIVHLDHFFSCHYWLRDSTLLYPVSVKQGTEWRSQGLEFFYYFFLATLCVRKAKKMGLLIMSGSRWNCMLLCLCKMNYLAPGGVLLAP